MGQAKRRGTFEERKHESLENKRIEEEKKREEVLLWWNSLSPEEQKEYKEKEHEKKMRLATLLGLASSVFQS